LRQNPQHRNPQRRNPQRRNPQQPFRTPSANDPPPGIDSAILDAVLACLVQYGSGGLTTRRIAALAQVNEVTLFRRFGSKEALIDAAIARECRLLQSAEVVYSGNLPQDLRKICAACARSFVNRPGALALLLEDRDKRFAPIFSEFHNLLARYMREGALHTEPVAGAFAALVGPCLFAAFPSTISGAQTSGVSFDIDAHVELYLHGRSPNRKSAQSVSF
jgi:AcrR family transcriptional regulator